MVALVFDLAATTAKVLLDRSVWKDYVDIAALLDAGHRLADIIGNATTVFDRRFAFPTPLFLRSLSWFADGTAPDVPHAARRTLEAVHQERGLGVAGRGQGRADTGVRSGGTMARCNVSVIPTGEGRSP